MGGILIYLSFVFIMSNLIYFCFICVAIYCCCELFFLNVKISSN